MTKSSRIMELYQTGMTVRAIANVVGCRPEYVRVVARQRMGKSQSACDLRYLATPKGKIYAARRDEATRQYTVTLYATSDKDKAYKAFKRAYREARLAGKSTIEATKLGNAARRRSIRKTGDYQRASRVGKAARRSFPLEAAE